MSVSENTLELLNTSFLRSSTFKIKKKDKEDHRKVNILIEQRKEAAKRQYNLAVTHLQKQIQKEIKAVARRKRPAIIFDKKDSRDPFSTLTR